MRRQADLDLLRHPTRWPSGVLPMKRPSGYDLGGYDRITAVVVHEDDGLRLIEDGQPAGERLTPEEILARGYVVDWL
jgi:hypothetical protein